MKKILIIGGAGFIGSHLSKQLLEKGCEVTVMDNLFTGNKSNSDFHRAINVTKNIPAIHIIHKITRT